MTDTVVDINFSPKHVNYGNIQLKENYKDYPLYLYYQPKVEGQTEEKCMVILEAFHTDYKRITDFLIDIAEPRSRPHFMHEYELTNNSLHAAVSGRYTGDQIQEQLLMYSKNAEIPIEITYFIRKYTGQYGKAKLVLNNNRYYITTFDKNVLSQIKTIAVVYNSHHKVKNEDQNKPSKKAPQSSQATSSAEEEKQPEMTEKKEKSEEAQVREKLMEMMDFDEEDVKMATDEEKELTYEVHPEDIREVKKECLNTGFPLLMEYDFKNDRTAPELEIELKTTTQLRPYQEKSLSKMFSYSRARSGVIVLPCGAGKTLVGITATTTVKKHTIIMCTSQVAAEQWKQQFNLWSTISMDKVFLFSSSHKERRPKADEAGVVITTYNMITGGRSAQALEILSAITEIDWGLIILDEVQVAPADQFQKVVSMIKSHTILGLTATLVREDDKIADLNHLIGPKLYEANWLDLQKDGHLARVQCIEVWCDMTPEFFMQYLKERSNVKKLALFVNNPNKIMACQWLMEYHEKRGDKVIVFSDNIYAIETIARKLERPFIHGGVGNVERQGILTYFQRTNEVNTIFLSRVGDTSIDLPGANVIIQISSHFGSRKQEAQRLGRILRPKDSGKNDRFNAFFYTLVSKNTKEMFYAVQRQKFLTEQGYAFQVIRELKFMGSEEEKKKLKMSTETEQHEMLSNLLSSSESKHLKETNIETDEDLKAMQAHQKNLTGASGEYEVRT